MENQKQSPGKFSYRIILQFFLQGLLILAPITITGFLLYWLFEKIDGILRPLVNIRGLGFLIIIGFVIFIGWLSSNFLMSSLLRFFDYWLERTPGVKFIYTSVKDFFGAFTGDKKKFDKAVIVNVFSEDVWIIGFLTDEELAKFELGSEYVSVYVPQSYNFAGQLYMVKRSKVKMIQQISSGEAMKYSVTGGVVELNEEKTV
ncbi:MAG: DUF502 domain-containing protein [Bacteroidetes bacterium]|nr:MAG: DUF502 domain-containing protein [Bacteroidota bacterium]